MIITTTNSIEGKTIKEYLGVVNSNIVLGTNFISEIFADFSDVFGGTSGKMKKKLGLIYDKVMDDLRSKALSMNADAVIGLSIDFDEMSGAGRSMFMVSANGTAVTFANPQEDRYSMYRNLAEIYDFKVKGILTEEEYEFEKENIKAKYFSKGTIQTDLEQRNKEKEEELERKREEEYEREQALKSVSQIINEKFSEFKGQEADLDEATILSASYDDLAYDESDDIQYTIARFIRLNKFAEACKFYMDATGLEDTCAAADYCLYVHKQIQAINQKQLASLISKMKVLKKRGFKDQAIGEYQKLTLSDTISANEFYEGLE